MIRTHTRRFIIGAIAASLLISTAVIAAPSVQQVMKLMQANFRRVRDYRVDAVLTVKSQMVNVAGMPMTVLYKQPGKLHIDAREGFAMLPRNIQLGDPAADLQRNFRMKVVGTAKVDGRPAVILDLTPKYGGGEDMPETSHRAWVDSERGLVLSTYGRDFSGATMKSHWTYTRIDGKYWLPSEIRADFNVPSQPNGDGRRHHFRRMRTGPGTITIRFSNYRVNKGIPDSAFKS